jgi:putative methionine-R-sulfoxide reductase with GAF domain
MGKLAVPEYILNKPGPLTPAEFEKMKLHAGAGADILSSIAFPYPVVPIVRHHHENWNGSGYPDGIRGSDIPIGARILSVVDCFDALTSDRPYRPRLPDKDAIQILRDRRGTMYDPLVVDSFIRLYPTIVAPLTEEPQHPLTAIKKAAIQEALAKPSIHLEDITASSGEVMALFALADALANQVKLEDVGSILFVNLRRLVPHTFGVLFVYAKDTDELVAAYVSGESASLVTGMTVTMGQRLTGWVAANRQTIRNSDPVLDLGEVAKSISPRLRSCLSTPITVEKELVGVLSLYSAHHNSFSEEHERILEAVARQTSPAIRRALEKRDDDTSKRGMSSPDTRVDVIDVLPDNTCLALIALNEQFIEAGKLQVIVDQVTNHLQPYDLVFRRGTHQLAILCKGADLQEIRRAVRAIVDVDQQVKFAFTSVPSDGKSIDQLLAAADAMLARKDSGPSKHSVH